MGPRTGSSNSENDQFFDVEEHKEFKELPEPTDKELEKLSQSKNPLDFGVSLTNPFIFKPFSPPRTPTPSSPLSTPISEMVEDHDMTAPQSNGTKEIGLTNQ